MQADARNLLPEARNSLLHLLVFVSCWKSLQFRGESWEVCQVRYKWLLPVSPLTVTWPVAAESPAFCQKGLGSSCCSRSRAKEEPHGPAVSTCSAAEA